MFNIKNKRVLILGLGILGGGRSIARWAQKAGAKVTITDLKTKKALAPSVKPLSIYPITWHLGGYRKQDFSKAEIIIKNPAVPKELPLLKIARELNIPIYNEAGIFFTLAKRPIIGVTGTRGKSTTAVILQAILKKHFKNSLLAGNFENLPMFGIIDQAEKKSLAPIVLELSSWQIEGLSVIKQSPKIAILTNLYPDHLNRYKNKSEYYRAKFNLFKWQKSSDLAILNYDNIAARRAVKITKGKVYWFSVKTDLPGRFGTYIKKEYVYFKDKNRHTRLISKNYLPLAGEHNLSNALAAITAAKIYGLSNKQIKDGLKTVKVLPGRQQLVAVKKGIAFYNDTNATTPEATMACLAALGTSLIVIIGGVDKGLNYSKLARDLNRMAKAIIVLPGSASRLLLAELNKLGKLQIKIKKANSLKRAVSISLKIAKKGDRVVLSPAAASFNLFLNEFDRGRQFISLVKKI